MRRALAPSLSLLALVLPAVSAWSPPFFLSGATLSSSSLSSPAEVKRATVCNGHAELCERSYGNVSYVGTHNSYAIGANNIATNQDQTVTTQLNDGIRMLQVQAHNTSSGIHLCHSSCLLFDGGLLSTYLTEVMTWVTANPSEVLSILIVNSNGLPASAFASVYAATGMDAVSFRPNKATTALADWPTLGSMVDSGQRVVTFMDNKANFVAVPYIIDEFANVVEDPFNALTNDFPCTANRSSGTPANQLVLTNHFLDVGTGSSVIVIPDKTAIVQTNSETGKGSLGQGASNCAAIYRRWPTFMLVDFYNSSKGAVFRVAASLNGVSAPTNTVATYSAGTTLASTATATGSTTRASTSVESLSGGGRSIGTPFLALGVLAMGGALGALSLF